jgi:ubiquinone/menaquinone biosynthesis C-methylase UbiE
MMDTKKIYGEFFFKNKLAEVEDQKSRIAFHIKEYERVFANDISFLKGKSVLESGCGPGSHTRIIADLIGKAGKLTSFDLSEKNIEKVKIYFETNPKGVDLEILTSPAEQFSYKNNSFDVVFCHNWIHHSDDPVKSLFNIIKPLKVGGLFYLCTYQSRTFRSLICELLRPFTLKIDVNDFLKKVPLAFPEGFAHFGHYPIIFYENLIDDYLVPNVRFTHYEILKKLFGQLGFEIIEEGVSDLLRRKRMFDVEEIPLKLVFKKIKEVDYDQLTSTISINDFYEESSIPFLSKEQQTIIQELSQLGSAISNQSELSLFCLAVHRFRCHFALDFDAHKRFESMKRFVNALQSGTNDQYSIHNDHEQSAYISKQHPLYTLIQKTTPSTDL